MNNNLISYGIYFSTFLLNMYLGKKFKKSKLNEKNGIVCNIISTIIIFMPLIILSGRRVNVGTDYWSYYAYPNALGSLNVIEYINIYSFKEIGFFLICKLCYLFNNRYIIYYLLTYLICYFIFIFYKKNKRDLDLPMVIFIFCLFFFPKSLNITRQILAVSILLNAFYNIGIDMKKYILFTIGAISIHTTAIISLVVLPYFLIKQIKGKYLEISLVIIYTIISFIVIYCFRYYFASDYVNNSGLYSGSNLLQLLILLLQFVFMIFYRYILKIRNMEYDKWLLIFFYGILFFVVYKNYQWGFRISYYFFIALIYVVPKVWQLLKRNTIFNIGNKFLIISFYILQFILLYGALKYDEIFPLIFR